MTGVNEDGGRELARLNSLGISASVLDAMLDRLDATEGQPRGPRKREHARWPFRKISIELEVQHPGGSATRLKVATRNLSRGGMSLLHSMYLHAKSRCTVHLPVNGGEPRPVAASIARCTHRGGRVHEVGLRFDHPIDLRDFYDRKTAARMVSLERVDPLLLAGTAVCCTRGESEFNLVRSLIADTRIALRRIDANELLGLERLEGATLLILGQSQQDQSGTQLLRRLRERGVGIGAMLLAADIDALAEEGFFEIADVALASTPITREVFHATLAEMLLVRTGAGDCHGGSSDDTVSWSARVALQELRDRLTRALENDDAGAIEACCVRLGDCARLAHQYEVALLAERAQMLVAAGNKSELAQVLLRMVGQLDATSAHRAA